MEFAFLKENSSGRTSEMALFLDYETPIYFKLYHWTFREKY